MVSTHGGWWLDPSCSQQVGNASLDDDWHETLRPGSCVRLFLCVRKLLLNSFMWLCMARHWAPFVDRDFCRNCWLSNNHTETYCKCLSDSLGLLLISSYILNQPIILIYTLPHGGNFVSTACSSCFTLHLLVTPPFSIQKSCLSSFCLTIGH